MSEATGRGRLSDMLARLGEPEGERGRMPFWEGCVFTRDGQLRATSSDEEVLAVLSGMTHGRGPAGMQLESSQACARESPQAGYACPAGRR